MRKLSIFKLYYRRGDIKDFELCSCKKTNNKCLKNANIFRVHSASANKLLNQTSTFKSDKLFKNNGLRISY